MRRTELGASTVSGACGGAAVCVCAGAMTVLSLTSALVLGLSGCTESPGQGTESAARGTPVTTVIVQRHTLRKEAAGVGSLQAAEQVEIRAELPGLVREILFEEGQQVSAGMLLFRLDDAELQDRLAARQAALRSAEANLANAKWEFERMRRLREQDVAAVEELKQARDRYHALAAKVDQLGAEVEVIREQIDDTHVRAPLAGRVTEHLVDEGDFVDAGDPLVSLYTLDPLELTFSLSEHFADQVHSGQRVLVTIAAYPGEEFAGEVSFVSPVIARQTREFRVKATLPNREGWLKPGAFARGRVVLEVHADRPVIPEECLINLRTGYAVFVVENGVAHRRDVNIGLREPGRVQIVSGLKAGEEIVHSGHMQLGDNDRVRVVAEDYAGETATQPTTQRAVSRPTTERHRP